jgi:hypothetical protein
LCENFLRILLIDELIQLRFFEIEIEISRVRFVNKYESRNQDEYKAFYDFCVQIMCFQNNLMLMSVSFVSLIFFFKKFFWSTSQRVRFFIDFVESIDNFKVESREKLKSSFLTTTELFCWSEVFQVFMIEDDVNKKSDFL